MSTMTLAAAAQLLGVALDAAPSALRRAYRAAARRLHPDTLGRPARPAEVAAMAAVNVAYTLLRSRPRPKRSPLPPAARPADRVIDMSEHLMRRPKPGPLRPMRSVPPVTPPARVATPPRTKLIRPRPLPTPVEVRHEPVDAVHADPRRVAFDFGRYAGWTVAEVERADPDYCEWALRHARTPQLRAALRTVRARRSKRKTP